MATLWLDDVGWAALDKARKTIVAYRGARNTAQAEFEDRLRAGAWTEWPRINWER